MNPKKYAIAILTTAVLWTAVTLQVVQPIPRPAFAPKRAKAPLEMRLNRYIKDEYIAEVISKSKYPVLIAALAKVESDYRPQIVGDHGRSKGLYQIRKSLHGDFANDIESQTKKCESIIIPLIKTHGLQGGIRRYNGSGKMAHLYSRKVLKIMSEIERA